MSRRAGLIRILNPQGTIHSVSFSTAIYMIEREQATPAPNVPNAILLIAKDAVTEKPVVRDSRYGYDRCVNRGQATLKQVRNLPVMAPITLFVKPTRKTKLNLPANPGALGCGIDVCAGSSLRTKDLHHR